MPFVHIELVEGRSEEALTKMMEEVTEAVHRNTGAPKEHIHIIINEMKKGNYAVDGKWK
ncbi:4-oxalocrotonate tautomerase [Enterococcus asini]|uniref:Tautomerase n=1 Tax=Enterococcus asini TaxID=57732 RepID=A0AAW8U373_9ENTE|nr:2-hydroxymuconate tautomerase [Enterococcus asini]MCD5029210.1 4-oxalocrotonate tautomerase [Enterococcus asini]MDT2744774.1 4-oxalocrotonate tautomerase [Enterococcus asini]MDT2764215.1 4-oxalocrotonate tautomerase [Enterococcus asini]MDT2784494.1 4-oxalocrotonate tautomerase [Enterococcus asini]MDT2810707.1 4-oxalocrotonate tautomerase [Enterococcus asini]